MNPHFLRDIASIQVGYQARGRIEDSVNGTHMLIQGKDFDADHRLKTHDLQAFNPDRDPTSYTVHAGDVIVQARGIENFAYFMETELKETLVAGSFYILRIRDDVMITPEYLCWWINQPQAQNYFKAQASGTWMSFISKSTLSQLSVQIPEPTTQEKIVQSTRLLTHEKALCKRLSELRHKLVSSVCAKAIKEQGETK